MPRHCEVTLVIFYLAAAITGHTRLVADAATEFSRQLHAIPLIPGDSQEARRRMRQRRQRQRRLDKEVLSGDGEDLEQKGTNIENDATDDPEESPFHMERNALYEGYGVHYVDLWVGCTTPQRVTVIVDTGSAVTGFPCAGCHHCGGDAESNDEHIQYHTDAVFEPNKSECFEKIGNQDECLVGSWKDEECRASRHYSEGSAWDAYEAVDVVYTGGDHKEVDAEREKKDSFKLHFACQDKVSGLFETQLADGIMGMYKSKESYWYQMYAAKKIENQAFSLCFSDPGRVLRSGTMAGSMVLGGTDKRLHVTPMLYAQEMKPKDSKFVVHLEKVYLAGVAPTSAPSSPEHLLPIGSTETLHVVQIFEERLNNNGQVIVDSGTTATYLTRQLENHFVSMFNSLVSKDIMELGSSHTHHLTLRQIQQLPTIVIQIRGWEDPDEENDGSNEGDENPTTKVPGIVFGDLDKRHAGKSILVRMPPLHYLAREDHDDDGDEPMSNIDPDEPRPYSFNVYFTKRDGTGGVLGANFLRGHDVLFDIENERIGFAESSCDYQILAAEEEEEAGR